MRNDFANRLEFVLNAMKTAKARLDWNSVCSIAETIDPDYSAEADMEGCDVAMNIEFSDGECFFIKFSDWR